MGEKNREKIDILYFVNRLLSRLLSPSILHTVLSSLQYPYTEHPKIKNFRYLTDILSDSHLVWTMKHLLDIQRTIAATWVSYDPNLNWWFPAPVMGTVKSGLGVAVLNNFIYAVRVT